MGPLAAARRLIELARTHVRQALSIIIAVSFLGMVGYSLANQIPESEVGGLLIGALISAFTVVVGWWFAPFRQKDGGDQSGE